MKWYEIIQKINEEGLIWDDRYYAMEIPEYYYIIDFNMIRNFLVELFEEFSLCEVIIDPGFYQMGRNLASKLRKYTPNYYFDDQLNSKYFVLDTFSSFEEVKSTYTPGHVIWIKEKYCPSSPEEYFVLTRAIIMQDSRSCIPFMNDINLDNENKDVQLFYNRLWDKIGPECRRLKNKSAN
jgi:hypothetical protein